MRYRAAVMFTTISTLFGASSAASDLLWDNGEWDFNANIRSDRNTNIPESWAIDDAIFPHPVRLRGYEWCSFLHMDLEPVAADFIVLTQGFEVVCELWDLPFKREFITEFWNVFDLYTYSLDLDIRLPPGRYYLGARPVGTGAGAFLQTLHEPILGESQGYWRSAALGYPNWVTINDIHGSDFDLAFRVYGNVTCHADIDGNGGVGFEDLVALLAAWGECDHPTDCPEDLDGSGQVDFADVVSLLAAWGPCTGS